MRKCTKHTGGKTKIMKFKDSKLYGCVTIIALSIIAIMGISSGIKNWRYTFGLEVQDLNEMVLSGDVPEKGDIVSLKADYVIDWYAELNERGPRGSRIITYHCMVLLDNNKVISMSVKRGKNYDKIEKLIEQSYDYYIGERTELPDPVYFEGSIRKIDSEIEEYYYTALYLAKADPNKDAYFVELDAEQSRILHLIFFIIGIAVAGVLVFLIIINATSNKKVEENNISSPIIPDNDPIFNKSFYNNNYEYGRVEEPINKDVENSSYEEQEYTSYDEDDELKEAAPSESKSKFSLKNIE